MRKLLTQCFEEKLRIISDFLLYQLRVPAATFWADKCVHKRVKVNEERKGNEEIVRWQYNSSEGFRFSCFFCLVRYWQSFSHR